MLALYRSGRQAEALDAYQDARRALVGGFGIEPSSALHQLQRAIFAQDASLDLPATPPRRLAAGQPAVVVAAWEDDALDAVLTIGEPLARSRGGDALRRASWRERTTSRPPPGS
jgi:DNA-binding SARP family transcriptional activator